MIALERYQRRLGYADFAQRGKGMTDELRAYPPALKIRVHGRVIDISPTAVRTGQDCAHNPAILMRSKAGIGIAREESGYARLGIVHVVKLSPSPARASHSARTSA